jgi:hypothetical protein
MQQFKDDVLEYPNTCELCRGLFVDTHNVKLLQTGLIFYRTFHSLELNASQCLLCMQLYETLNGRQITQGEIPLCITATKTINGNIDDYETMKISVSWKGVDHGGRANQDAWLDRPHWSDVWKFKVAARAGT